MNIPVVGRRPANYPRAGMVAVIARIFLAAALVLAGTAAHAQAPVSADEISFWESVRDSQDPAELQAYINQYPNGRFVVLAKSRLAALSQKPAAAPTPAPAVAQPAVPGAPHTLQAGDSWTYRLTYPRLRGQWGQGEFGQTPRKPATHVVTLSSIADRRVTDALSVDGGTPIPMTHATQPTLLVQGASIFSPYFASFGALATSGRIGDLVTDEPSCARAYLCEAKGRIAGRETVQVPAGKFLATKVVIDQQWRGASMAGAAGGRLNGGRTLTIWYAPEIGRAVKYSSRLGVGDATPMEPNFDIDLVSYQLK